MARTCKYDKDLSPREVEVVKAMLKLETLQKVSAHLGISVEVARRHLTIAREKLFLETREELLNWAKQTL